MRSQDTKSQAHWMKPGDTETGLGSVDQMATQFKDCSFKDYSQSSCFFPHKRHQTSQTQLMVPHQLALG